jgi:two-component system phosphate regulon sensor histidine kinase PhoR
MILLFSLAIAVGFALLFYYIKTYKNMLRHISEALKRISFGDYDFRLFPYGKEEYKELALLLNKVAEEQKRLLLISQNKQQQLQILFSLIKDPFLVLDQKGNVLFQNESSKSLCGEVEGRSFWELRSSSLREAIQRLRKNPSLMFELELNSKSFLLRGSESPEGELLVFLYDLTLMKNLERFKKDLIGIVSHELRTPLTAIKASLEALKEEEEGRYRYLEIIERNLERMLRLVEDLLSLSVLESGRVKLELKEFDLHEVLQDLLPSFQKMANEKALRLILEVPKPFILRADQLRLYELLYNLLDNAIRFTEKGWVKLKAQKTKEGVIIEISDSGIGIPPFEMDKIFERFYVIDKSRSRKKGGTGLGLSIVKHIVELHGGKIEVKSRLGEGSTFTVFLPSKFDEN